MADKLKLDDVDRQILRDLQDDGRMTNVELAKRAGISAPPCLRRVRVLEEAGVVRGYYADLDAEALGYNVHVFAFVGLTSQAEVDLQAFEEMVAEWPQVRECHMLMGEIDFLLKIEAIFLRGQNYVRCFVFSIHGVRLQIIDFYVLLTAKLCPKVFLH